jgi:hypothetical protein
MESSTAGFIGQLKGAILTTLRYKYATVFVDLYSDYTYVYLHTKITSEETLKAKKAFELHAESFGVKVKQYHADNGRFQDIAFKTHCEQHGQSLTFCGVNAHFQNGRAERRIRDLQDGARTSLLHAIKKWPTAITINLWPYALRYANDVNNHVPAKGNEHSPIELFSSTTTKLPIKQFYHFGCPVYVLDSNLQANKRAGSKWRQRTRLGVNLGFSPQHAKSVHLVLSLQSGCVSPQFHCTFDNNFQTLKEYNLPESQWQVKAHFIDQNTAKAENEHTRSPATSRMSNEQQPDVSSNVTREQQAKFEVEVTEAIPEIEPPQQPELEEQRTSEGAVHEGAEVRRSGRTRRPPSRYNDYVTNDQELEQAIRASMTTVMEAENQQECIAFDALHVPTDKSDHCEHNPIAVAMKSVADPKKKNSIDYFKCKSRKRIYPLGASLHYPVLTDWDFLT